MNNRNTESSWTFGIDVGSTTLKLCLIAETGEELSAISAHEGDLASALSRLLTEVGEARLAGGARGVVTGTEGRYRVRLPQVIAPVAIEKGLSALGLRPRAVVSMGGEDLVVYVLDQRGRIVSTYSGNKCASGTGEFFRQQLGRMDLSLADYEEASRDAKVYSLSARCSVFMKSDCTHRLNKGEATKGDIAVSLSKVMADKVTEFLTKAKIDQGQVVVVGGVAQNKQLMGFLTKSWPNLDLVVPKQAAYFEAFGAAHLAQSEGKECVPAELLEAGRKLSYSTFPPFDPSSPNVRYVKSLRGKYDPEAEYVLGVDGGSTTTKVALINRKTLEIVASHYGRTHGDPVAALKTCIDEVKKQLSGASPRITLVATTGSSRELLGVFCETAGVYNEIIAHTVGTTYFESQVDTIFEIGGQDAKYVSINNSVPIDYAMNEACSAGTGSFLEESARGDLSIDEAAEIGPIALRAKAPLKFGEHCSAFINSDIRKAIQQGAPREDIVAGLVFSIVANYLNRVVGNRHVGKHIVLQGGVAKNPAVPLAFAQMTGKQIVVPPDPELMGCFGVARLALRKCEEGLLQPGEFTLDAMLNKAIKHRNSFVCKACDNYCSIKNLEVGASRYPFGGRCSKYTNARRKRRANVEAVDYTAERTRMLFDEFAAKPETLKQRSNKVVGIPAAFSVHSLWPFYSHFFNALGVRAELSQKISPKGIARQASNYCFPAEIAHGAVQDCLDTKSDYLFLPHFRDMPSLEAGEVHACVCPLTQGLPYFARQAFGIPDDRILRPVVSFKHGFGASKDGFVGVAERLGFSASDGEEAYEKAVSEFQRYLASYRTLGAKALEEVQSNPDRLYVALLGRPYNAFTRDANMGIPRKITSHGVSVIPYDMLFLPDAEIYPNMYWYYGQENLKAVRRVKEIENLYLTWISNFSCAPDSFMLHYLRWMMGSKPYLVLEIDSHSADAGIDTRVEAFLDIVESYRRAGIGQDPPEPKPRYTVEMKNEYCDIVDHKTGEHIDVRDQRVTMVWPSMGDLSVEAVTSACRAKGIRADHLPTPDVRSTQLARNVASGKECIPALLVLGSVLQYFEKHEPNKPNEIYTVFVPSTLGPCRTGQYYVYYDRLFRQDLGWENVVPIVAGSQNSYREFGPTFNRSLWWSVVLSDYFTDVRTGIRLLAKDVDAGMKVFDQAWGEVVEAMGERGRYSLTETLRRARDAFAAIPKRRTLEDLKKVLIVGEIYVRRDNFSVQEITDFLVARDIYPKVTGVSEWFLYTDFARGYLMKERWKRDGAVKSIREGGLKEAATFYAEAYYKSYVEGRVHSFLAPTGFVPEVPHDMQSIITEGGKTFVDPELESEATVSPAVGAAAMDDGYSGVAIIAPFACLPGRLIEGVYAPWAKAKGYPVIALENDGQPYPPNIVSRMEVFANNVARFETRARRDKPGMRDLLEPVWSKLRWLTFGPSQQDVAEPD